MLLRLKYCSGVGVRKKARSSYSGPVSGRSAFFRRLTVALPTQKVEGIGSISVA